MPTTDRYATLDGAFTVGDRDGADCGLVVVVTCACGQRLVIADLISGLTVGVAIGAGALLLEADESAFCPCGRYAFPFWNRIASVTFGDGSDAGTDPDADDADQDDAGDPEP